MARKFADRGGALKLISLPVRLQLTYQASEAVSDMVWINLEPALSSK